MKLLIVNPRNGRTTEYDGRYLLAEARRIVRGHGKFAGFFVSVDDKHGAPTLVASFTNSQAGGSVTQLL